MQKPAIPPNERERLEALYSYDLLDLINQQEFQGIVDLAALICQTPISLITLVDTDKQWFKAKVGLDVNFTDREVSFCAHAINNPSEPFIVTDATLDERFKDNPLVTGDPKIVFYAGVPLITDDGHGLGSLCVIDRVPKELTEEQERLLTGLSQQVVRLFELRRTVKLLEEKELLLEQTIKHLDEFTEKVGHDLKMPFRTIEIGAEILRKKHAQDFDEDSRIHVNNIQSASVESMRFINNLLKYSRAIQAFNQYKTSVDTKAILRDICLRLDIPDDVTVNIPTDAPIIYQSNPALKAIFENLILNALRYKEEEAMQITITYDKEEQYHIFKIADNGADMLKKDHNSIIDLFHQKDLNSIELDSASVGLAIVYKLVELLGGKLKMDTKLGEDRMFFLKIPKEHRKS